MSLSFDDFQCRLQESPDTDRLTEAEHDAFDFVGDALASIDDVTGDELQSHLDAVGGIEAFILLRLMSQRTTANLIRVVCSKLNLRWKGGDDDVVTEADVAVIVRSVPGWETEPLAPSIEFELWDAIAESYRDYLREVALQSSADSIASAETVGGSISNPLRATVHEARQHPLPVLRRDAMLDIVRMKSPADAQLYLISEYTMCPTEKIAQMASAADPGRFTGGSESALDAVEKALRCVRPICMG